VTQAEFSIRYIINGNNDAYITKWALAARAWGHPFFLRFAHEMNGNWYPWSEKKNGNQAGEYVQAWRHVRNIFRQQGVTNVSWVWVPNIIISNSVPLEGLYSGDEYVDWVGMDGYNMHASNFRSFSTLVKPTYDSLQTITNSKPIMIAETSSVEGAPGAKADWFSSALTQLPTQFPQIKAFVIFKINKEHDWRIESSETAQAAFARGIASDIFATNTFVN